MSTKAKADIQPASIREVKVKEETGKKKQPTPCRMGMT
jgi:hypothetical protein